MAHLLLDILRQFRDILRPSSRSFRGVSEEEMMLKQIQEALLAGKKDQVEKLVDQALASGMTAASVLNEGLIVGMERLGDIGKNIVAMMLKGAGYKIIDLGIDVSPEKYVAAARENSASIVALSALLTTTMVQMKNVVEAVKATGLGIPVIRS